MALPAFAHQQGDIHQFILNRYAIPEKDIAKIERMYRHCEIDTRYSVLDDFALPEKDWTFFNATRPVSVEKRMSVF